MAPSPMMSPSAASPSDDLIGKEYQAAFADGSAGESPAEPAMLQPGTKLGERYTIVRKLGQGGMGVVYEARNANVEHIRYAIKTLLPGKPKADAEHFLQEARRASKVRSKHIVRISDFGTDSASGLTYMVMDYIGNDLETYMRSRGGTLPPRQAIDFCVQVCEALAAAHSERVVHRDIKPLNCLVHIEADQEIVVVTDFGIAREFRTAASHEADGQTDSLWTAIGTPGYIAPEVWLREARADHRVDIYSVGAMLFRMLVGQSPPLAPTVEELRKSGVPGVLLPLLSMALARSPRDRYATAKAMQTALCEAQASFAAAPTLVPAQPVRSLRLMIVTGCMLLATTAALLYVVWHEGPVPPAPVSEPAETVSSLVDEPPKDGLPKDAPLKDAPPKDAPPKDAMPKEEPVRPPDAVPETKREASTETVPVAPPNKLEKPKPRPLPSFDRVSSMYITTLRDFCGKGIPSCADRLAVKQQPTYRGKGSFLSRVGFVFSANVGAPTLVSKHANLDLKVERGFKTCVETALRKLRFSATSDGGGFECNVAL